MDEALVFFRVLFGKWMSADCARIRLLLVLSTAVINAGLAAWACHRV